MRLIIQNFMTMVTRYTSAVILNTIGLTIAFASFIVIMMQVSYELGYDRHYTHADRIYQLTSTTVKADGTLEPWDRVFSRPLGDRLIAASPDIEAGGNFMYSSGSFTAKVYCQGQEKERGISGVPFEGITPALLDVFSFEAMAGKFDHFSEPGTGIISESLAVQIFGTANPIGQTLIYADEDDPTEIPIKITAVYRDFPKNSTLCNGIYMRLNDQELHDFNSYSSVYYLRLRRGADRQQVEQALVPVLWEYNKTYQEDTTSSGRLRLLELNDAYFSGQTWSGERGNRNITYSLLVTALLILLIAAINFINFAIAQAPRRIRNLNMHKIFGCSRKQLQVNLITEAVCLTLISLLLALCLVQTLSTTSFSSWVMGGISLTDHIGLIGWAVVTALGTGFIAGFYPALYITSFTPALVLKGSFAVSPTGRRLRMILISIQFIISITLMIVALFIHIQNRFMQHYDIGMNREHILVLPLTSSIRNNPEPFIQRLKSDPRIQDLTQSYYNIIEAYGMVRTCKYKNREIEYTVLPVSPNFISFMGLQVIEGCDFHENDRLRPYNSLIFNQKAQKQFDLTVPDRMNEVNGLIVGITKDFHFRPLHYSISPIALLLPGTQSRYRMYYILIKVDDTHPESIVADIKKVYQEMDPAGEIPELTFLNESIGELYKKEKVLADLVTIFSLLSILISMIGVFGIIHFEIQYRRTEIALRKVYGSTSREVLWLFNMGYIRIVGICFVIAAPLAYWIVRRWLENFAYKVPLYAGVFLIVFLVIVVIVVTIITTYVYRTATTNPIKAIKTE